MGLAGLLNMSQCLSVRVEDFSPRGLPPSTVAIVQSREAKAEDITESEIASMVREAVGMAGGFSDLVRDGDVVVIKPNLVTVNDYTLPGWGGRPLSPEVNGTTTDYRVTKAVVQLVRDLNPSGKVFVMEGSSIFTKQAFLHHKYTHSTIPGVDEFIAIEEDSGGYREKDSDNLIKVAHESGRLHKEYYVNRRLAEADVVITIPCLKNHWHAVITGAIKNMGIGATPGNIYGNSREHPGRNSMVDHESMDLHYWIHDYYMVRPVDFIVMDGLQGIQNGPTPSREISGTTDISRDQMNMRLILAAGDAVAVDTIESLIMGWDPYSVPYLCLLNADGVGNIDTARINVKGKEVDEVRKPFEGRSANPACKGSRITDTAGPLISIARAVVTDKGLSLNIRHDQDLHAVRLFLDGSPVGGQIREGFTSLSIPTDLTEAERLTVFAYDRFLNKTVKTVFLPLPGEGIHEAVRTDSPPVIDGKADERFWEKARWYPIDRLWLGSLDGESDFSGRFKISWNDRRLFLLVEIEDDVLSDIRTDPLDEYYNDDCLELFIDEDKSGGIHTASYNAFAYHISIAYDVVDLHTDSKPRVYHDHIEVKRNSTGNLSIWEMAVTVYDENYRYGEDNQQVVLVAGKEMGFALAYCDSDASGRRESFIGSVYIEGEDKNRGWIDADVFGTLILTE